MITRLKFLLLSLTLVSGLDEAQPVRPGAVGGPDDFEIVGCSLGCSPNGDALSCGVSNIAVNEEFVIEFNQAIDVTSVNSNSFELRQAVSGAQPPGTFSVDPDDPRRLIFRPQLAFNWVGDPVFGLESNATYNLTIPGTLQSPALPPSSFLRSVTGELNRKQLDCTLTADQGVNDLNPGSPRVGIFADTVREVDPVTQEPTVIVERVLLNGGIRVRDIYRDTEIEFVFNDVMNPGKLVVPYSGEAPRIVIAIDPDGNPQDASDQVELPGTYSVDVDAVNLRTTVRFTPAKGLPSAGSNADAPRLLVISLLDGIVDLAGNPLANPGKTLGVPEKIAFAEQVLPGGMGEDFGTTDLLDASRTGAIWGPEALLPGAGGGSGQLGDLVIGLSETVVLSTTSQEFEPGGLIDNYDTVTGMPAAGEETITIDDGIFEFSRVEIQPGGTLRFEGDKPARLFVRGTASISGVVDVSGADADSHPSMPCNSDPTLSPDDPSACSGAPCDPEVTDPFDPAFCEDGVYEEYLASFNGGAGGAGGPAGGSGGAGADLPHTVDAGLLAAGGIFNPNGVGLVDGAPGSGVPIPNALDPTGSAAGGEGGTKFPSIFPSSLTDLGDGVFSTGCDIKHVGAPGAGGGYGTPGSHGKPKNVFGFGQVLTPIALGGDPSELAITELVRELSPELGFLRGGSGGGGGGSHITRTKAIGALCGGFFGEAAEIESYWPSSGAGGGGAGGAIQIQAGESLFLNGAIDARGGDGGQRLLGSGRESNATAGGGGSGGGVLIQSPHIDVVPGPGRIHVGQGYGGLSIGQGARGGDGGAGLIRVESGLSPANSVDFDSLVNRIEPNLAAIPFYPQPAAIEDVLSVDQWGVESEGPGIVSGAQSCWIGAEGNVFVVNFAEDAPTHRELGWDMTVVVDGAELSWRTPRAGLGGMSLEDIAGSDLGSSPIVVRFQGARAVKPIEDVCDVELTGPSSPIFEGSVSPWVRHPAELNDFFESPTLQPNLIRYQVLFDRGHELASLVEGVTNLEIRSFPD